MGNLILDEISAAVKSQLDQQAASGVRIVQQDDVPDTGPVRGGVWLQIPEATAVFVDLKGSTGLNARFGPEAAAHAYNYFNRAMAVILNGFQARYVDVQGDGLFGLFSGKGSRFLAAACAITMKTQVETLIAGRFRRDVSADWELRAGIGVDRGKLLVRQLGLRCPASTIFTGLVSIRPTLTGNVMDSEIPSASGIYLPRLQCAVS